jgi:hypothetical protein
MKKIFNKQKASLLTLFLMMLMLTASLTTAQTDSLNVWENIAGGTLTTTWTEKTTTTWAPGNVSGIGYYNCTTAGINWTTPSGAIFGDQGHRWYQTFEVKVDDANMGIGCIYAYHNATNWDGWLYILDDRYDANPGLYLVKNAAGTVKYANATTGTINMSNAIDYSGDCEVDYLNSVCRVKSIYNGYNHSLMVKIWDPTGDEPVTWLYNSHSTKIKATASNNMTCGLLAICGDGESDKAMFRRIFFWNLSYDLYGATTKPEIICPTYDAMSFFDFLMTLSDAPDLWNQTALMQGFFNSWDLTSTYTNKTFVTTKTNSNDTTYIFTNMLTNFVDFWEELFPADPLPDEAPDNTLLFNIYATPDGTPYGEADDYILIRIDSDNNGVYNNYDYAIWGNATGFDTGHFYRGWTELTDPDQWYGLVGEAWSTSDDYGELFKDRGYHIWGVYINWDLLYNGATGERIGDDLCRMSISFYDKNSTHLIIGQDYNESNDRTNKTASDKHNGLLSPTWEGANITTNWFYFQVDESLSGEQMADPDDPYYESYPQVEINIVTIAIPILLVVFLMFMVLSGAIATPQGIIAFLITLLLVFVTLMMIFT